MIDRGQWAMAAACAVMVLAGGLKATRYAGTAASAFGPQASSAVDRIVDHMGAAGWSRVRTGRARDGDLYDWIAFAHAACPNRMTIGILGGNVEMAELFRRDRSDAVAFLQGGELLANPSGLRRQMAGIRDQAVLLFGLTPRHGLPLLAISPPPADDGGECRGPSAAGWRLLAGDGPDRLANSGTATKTGAR